MNTQANTAAPATLALPVDPLNLSNEQMETIAQHMASRVQVELKIKEEPVKATYIDHAKTAGLYSSLVLGAAVVGGVLEHKFGLVSMVTGMFGGGDTQPQAAAK